MLRLAAGRTAQPSAAILDSRTLCSTPRSGSLAGYDGPKRTKGAKLHLAVDTLGHPLALHVTPASIDDHGATAYMAQAVQAATGQSVELAALKLPEAKRAFVLLAAAPGREKIRRLGHPLPAPGEGLRASCLDPCRSPPRGLYLHHARAGRPIGSRSETGSRPKVTRKNACRAQREAWKEAICRWLRQFYAAPVWPYHS